LPPNSRQTFKFPNPAIRELSHRPVTHPVRRGIQPAGNPPVGQPQRAGIANDPNREDDHECLVQLIWQEVTFSVKMMRLAEVLVAVEIGAAKRPRVNCDRMQE